MRSTRDPILDERDIAPARRLVASLFGTLKLMQLYGTDHDATADALRNLCEAVRVAAGTDREARLQLRGTRLQVNDRTMRASDCGNLALSFLVEEWTRRRVETVKLRFDAAPEDLAAFAFVFLDVDTAQPDPVGLMNAALVDAQVHTVVIEARDDTEQDPILLEEGRDQAMRSYLQGLKAFREVLRDDGYPDRRKVRRARRAVQGLVDRFLEDEATVLALAQLRGNTKLFRHSLNVSLFAMVLGQRLGMSRRQLGELGLAALFHDLGKTENGDEANDESASVAGAAEPRDHPARGARMLLAESGGHEGMLKAAIVAYEHHANYDRSGYPAIPHEQHLFSRIIAIADCYEALVTEREGKETCSAYDAFRLMQAKSGTMFDPLLLKVFMSAVGVYPVGTLVELSTGEVAVVADGPADPDRLDRPTVRIVRTGQGLLIRDTEVDLSTTDKDGSFVRSIQRICPAHEVFESPGELLTSFGI